MTEKWYHQAIKEGESITPVMVRDEMVECFLAAQKECLELAAEAMHRKVSDEDLRKSVTVIIKAAFREAEEDFEHPTKDGLMKVMQVLKRKSAATGKEAEIIEHHAGQMMELLGKMH